MHGPGGFDEHHAGGTRHGQRFIMMPLASDV